MRDIDLKVERVPLDALKRYKGNAKLHPEEQVEQIAESMREFGNCDPIAVWTNGAGELEIVEGHGRLLALRKLGAQDAPVIFLDHLTDEQRRAYVHVHNQTTLNSGFDMDVLQDEIDALPEFDWEAFGFTVATDDEEQDDTYTMDTNIPQYEPTGDVPNIRDIVDTEKAAELMEEIEASGVSKDEKKFLTLAACRHYVFDYRGAAEYYAQADEEMQRLMERSALVLIDVDDAIKYGYANLSEEIERMALGGEDDA